MSGWMTNRINRWTNNIILIVESTWWEAASHAPNLSINHHWKVSTNLLLKYLFSGKSSRLCNPGKKYCHCSNCQNLCLGRVIFRGIWWEDMIPESELVRASPQLYSKELALSCCWTAAENRTIWEAEYRIIYIFPRIKARWNSTE